MKRFGPGPWDHEPDRLDWEHAGLKCAIRRAHLGHLCGYVGVPPGHPLHGAGLSSTDVLLDVHGGLTWADDHVPMEKPDGLWWFGFDCAHYGSDYCPNSGRPPRAGEVYRDVEYVKAQTEKLADQLAALLPVGGNQA